MAEAPGSPGGWSGSATAAIAPGSAAVAVRLAVSAMLLLQPSFTTH